MRWLNTILLLISAYLSIFCESSFQVTRHWLGAQIDVLPALVVYCALRSELMVLGVLSLAAGVGFDSLSANPLGVTVLPLFLVGLAIHSYRDLILREQFFAQAALGVGASVATPLLTLVLLLTTGHRPLLGWGTLWQLLVMAIAGGVLTPLVFEIFGFLNQWLAPQPYSETSFRPDREIRRGR